MKIIRCWVYRRLFSFLLLLAAGAQAETFRVQKTVPMRLATLDSEVKTTASMNDALFITLPDDKTFVSGIELKFKIPEIIAAWRDTIAYSLYDDITPAPQESVIDYAGTRISVNTFPGKLSHIVYIPLSEDMDIKQSPYHEKIPVIPQLNHNGVFFRMQLAMKGVPEDFENAVFEVSAKPVLANKGTLFLTISEPQGEHKNYTVFIDELPFSVQPNGTVLATGEHHLAITSDDYRNEVRTFRIEQAKATKLEVAMRGVEPIVRLVTPENAQAYFDGALLTNTKDPFTVTQGDHTIRFVIGDYEVVRTVNAVNGRTYTVNLSVDAAITEDDEEIQ